MVLKVGLKNSGVFLFFLMKLVKLDMEKLLKFI